MNNKLHSTINKISSNASIANTNSLTTHRTVLFYRPNRNTQHTYTSKIIISCASTYIYTYITRVTRIINTERSTVDKILQGIHELYLLGLIIRVVVVVFLCNDNGLSHYECILPDSNLTILSIRLAIHYITKQNLFA